MVDDEEYFKDRKFEPKYFYQAQLYIDGFDPKKVLDVGCALGHFVFAFQYLGVEAHGCDQSQYAVENAKEEIRANLKQGDLAKTLPYEDKFADLVICYDVLEHLTVEQVPWALSELKRVCSKNLLLSVCMLGDPNYYMDDSHKTLRSREWWEKKVEEAGFKIKPVPDYFMFKNQLIVAEVLP